MRAVQVVGMALAPSLVLCVLGGVSAPVSADELILQAKDSDEIALEIEYPTAGSVVSDFGCGCFVAGRAFRGGFDIALVLDTSGSTAAPSGADINRNGTIGARRGVGQNWIPGTRSSDSGDSVLAAEVAAAERLLKDLDPRITRVAVISFSGDFEPGSSFWRRGQGERPAVITHLPLTHDFRRVRDALRGVRLAGSDGGTDMAAGVRRGFVELSGLRGARSERNYRNQLLMFFFTDGVLERGKDYMDLLAAARRAHKLEVRVHTFAIGDSAVRLPVAAVQLADMTGGEFTPVVNPGELSAVLETIEFANLEQISIRSRPLGADAELVHWAADGSWGGFVKLATGTNRIEVSARLADGSVVTEFVDVKGNHSETPASIPNPLTDRYTRLRKDCLRRVRGEAIMTSRAADRRDLKKLKLEIERERARARQRAAEQRKSLQLEVEDEDEQPDRR
ncbi:MAG: VWA domain-containing protein [Myxococcota bacterium]